MTDTDTRILADDASHTTVLAAYLNAAMQSASNRAAYAAQWGAEWSALGNGMSINDGASVTACTIRQTIYPKGTRITPCSRRSLPAKNSPSLRASSRPKVVRLTLLSVRSSHVSPSPKEPANMLAQDFDPDDVADRYRAIARFAQRHDCQARVVVSRHDEKIHVLVTNPSGEILATRSALRLCKWLGY